MSLALILANSNGIVMSADHRITFPAPCDVKASTAQYNNEQKLFLTKNSHGIACTGDLGFADGNSVSAIIKYELANMDNFISSVKDELIYIGNKLMEHKPVNIIALSAAGIENGKWCIFTTELEANASTFCVDESLNNDPCTLYGQGEKTLVDNVLELLEPSYAFFPLQVSVDFIRFVNQTVSGFQFFSGNLQTVSPDCDVLVIDNCGAHWFIPPAEPQ